MIFLFLWIWVTVIVPGFAGFLIANYRATRLLQGLLLVAGIGWALTIFTPGLFIPDPVGSPGPDSHIGPGFARSANQAIAGAVFISLLVGWLIGRATRDN